MPQKVLCSDCGYTLYEGHGLKSPDIVLEYIKGGKCPQCSRKLSYFPLRIEVKPYDPNSYDPLTERLERLRNVSVDKICEERGIPYWKRWMGSDLKYAVKPRVFEVLTSDNSVEEMSKTLEKSKRRIKSLRCALIKEGLTKPRSKTTKQYVKKKEVTDISIDPRIVSLFTPSKDHFDEIVECSSCGFPNIVKDGYRLTKHRKIRRFRCKSCGCSSVSKDMWYKMKYSPEIIVTSLLLSLEDISTGRIVEYLDQKHGIKVSHVAISRWIKKYNNFLTLLSYLKDSFESELPRILGVEPESLSHDQDEIQIDFCSGERV